MNSQTRNLWFWLTIIAVTLLAVYLLRSILLPFVLGMAMAYFLDPAADRLERWKLSRGGAALLITLIFFSAIVLALSIAIPVLAGQLTEMIAAIPGYVEQFNQNIAPMIEEKLSHISPSFTEEIKNAIGNASGAMASASVAFFSGALSSGMAFVNVILLLLITPIVAFYMLRDWDRIMAKLDSLIPRRHIDTVHEQIAIIDCRLSGFVRGQLIVCTMLGIYYALGLTLAGLNFGFIIGLATGFLTILPYAGVAIGMIIGLLVAVFQFDSITPIIVVAVVFASGQFIEGNFITPKLVGDKVGLHPVWMIFAMLAGAALFGFVGALLAIPVAAILGVLTRFAITRYQQSSYFQ